MLKVKFIRYKNVVITDILEQGEEIERGAFEFKFGEYRIENIADPCLEGNLLYLKGRDNEFDNYVGSWDYNTEEDAIEAVKGFTTAIKAYNDTLKPKQKKQENDGVEITIAG